MRYCLYKQGVTQSSTLMMICCANSCSLRYTCWRERERENMLRRAFVGVTFSFSIIWILTLALAAVFTAKVEFYVVTPLYVINPSPSLGEEQLSTMLNQHRNLIKNYQFKYLHGFLHFQLSLSLSLVVEFRKILKLHRSLRGTRGFVIFHNIYHIQEGCVSWDISDPSHNQNVFVSLANIISA